MIKSMTAFARSESKHDFGALTWELRSVNHRYLDINLRLPEELRGIEQQVRETVSAKLSRGKIDASLRFRAETGVAAPLLVDKQYAANVVQACQDISDLMPNAVEADVLGILRWPGVVKEPERDVTPIEKAAAALLSTTLKELIATREREGVRIDEMLRERCENIKVIVENVRQRRPQVLDSIKTKVQSKIDELNVQVDNDRLEQEMVIYAQRMDVDEELDRLQAHTEEVLSVLKNKKAVGRRLDFLMQELNREANTLSSKSADADTTKASVDLKVLIEQMREQIQNVE